MRGLLRWGKLLCVVGAVGGFVALLGFGFTTNPRAIPPTLTGTPAPDFSLRLLDGRNVRLADFRGKVIFLNFWASWCPPCRVEAPLLEEAWQRYREHDVVFLGIDIQDTDEAARRFLEEFWISYMNGRDPNSRIAIEYGVYGIPETFFIDPEGRITYKHVGALDRETIIVKLGDASRGIASTAGKSQDYRGISVR